MTRFAHSLNVRNMGVLHCDIFVGNLDSTMVTQGLIAEVLCMLLLKVSRLSISSIGF